jgi:hypothetical protein
MMENDRLSFKHEQLNPSIGSLIEQSEGRCKIRCMVLGSSDGWAIER